MSDVMLEVLDRSPYGLGDQGRGAWVIKVGKEGMCWRCWELWHYIR